MQKQNESNECVFACDIDKNARATYETAYGTPVAGDIRLVNVEDVNPHEILFCGLPCQTFSTIGSRKGFADDRGTMIFEVMRFVRHHKPRFVVLENVVGLLSHEKGATFGEIVALLRAEGYYVNHTVLNCKDHGIPQSRRRLFILCGREKPVPMNFGEKSAKSTKSLTDFGENRRNSTKSLTDFLKIGDFDKQYTRTIRTTGRYTKITNTDHNWSHYMLNNRVYQLQIEDALRLQGFPVDFPLKGSVKQQWRQLGNTIPTNLSQLVVNCLPQV
jgi:DNA (cytosine-5)-methyltransferase 1